MSEKSTIRIRKIKLADKGEKIIMAYERSVNNQWDEYHFTSSEQAAPEFYGAFAKLAGHVACLCELPGRYDERLEMGMILIMNNICQKSALKRFGN